MSIIPIWFKNTREKNDKNNRILSPRYALLRSWDHTREASEKFDTANDGKLIRRKQKQ